MEASQGNCVTGYALHSITLATTTKKRRPQSPLMATLIHSCPTQKQLSVLGQY